MNERATSAYVHFPWCLQKCPYCDFASATIKRPDVPHRAYADAVIAELEARREHVAGQPLGSVFFGGGTPSLWDPAELGRVLRAIRGAFAREAGAIEITVECNPSSLDRDKARALFEQGVNRLSIGVQSLDAKQLQFLGRLHDGDGALRALESALQEVPRVSGDLIFGLPGQPVDEAVAHIERLVGLGLSHVSAYSLTIEPGTQFGELHKKGRLPIAIEDDVAQAYLAIESALAARGFGHYEVSNYAHAGQESRHNEHYWRGGAYLGLGAGAVGCLHEGVGRARRYRNQPKPERYIAQSAQLPELEVFEEALGPSELVQEQLMLGLRTRRGMDLTHARTMSGSDPLEGRERAVQRALDTGDLAQQGDALLVPAARWLRLDGIIAGLF
jgi:putative oxygen-independent coproporphyrinogen III oxidase